jgi:hypothetical protein
MLFYKRLRRLVLLSGFGFLVTSYPNPKKVRELIQLNDHQKVHDKYKALFDQSIGENSVNLEFYALSKDRPPAIFIRMKKGHSFVDWQLDLLHFQQKLARTNTKYQEIDILDGIRPNQVYSRKSLETYTLASELFTENIAQIKKGEMNKLYQSMDRNRANLNQLKDLFDFIQITNYANQKIVTYPSVDLYSGFKTVFRLDISKNTCLYFTYKNAKNKAILSAIDLNQQSVF